MDIDKEHDLTDPDVFRQKIEEENEASKAPCGNCTRKQECVQPFYCKQYKAWRKRYLRSIRG